MADTGELYRLKKEELSKDLNDFFGVDVNWAALSKDDLVAIYSLFADEKRVIQSYAKQGQEQVADHQIASIPDSIGSGKLLAGLGSGQLLDGFADHMVQSGAEYIQKNRPLRKMIKDRLGGLGR